MTNYEIYVFALCAIVFTLLTAMFSYLLYSITKSEIELIRAGLRDVQIQREYEKKNTAFYKVSLILSKIVSLVLCLTFACAFAGAMYVKANDDRPANGIPSLKVVKSTSMAEKNKKNEYLFENKLNDQFQQFDLVICGHLPAEEELELYDIVVYKTDDMYVIHRIVGIEEPNEKHPNERHFLLQGDAVDHADKFPVLYSQMQGIYKGNRIPFVGSFIMFLQSPAGWLCMLLVVFVMIATPIVEGILNKAKRERLGIDYSEYKEYIRSGRKAFVPSGSMSIHYNRPGSPYSEPFQRQDQEVPYRHSKWIDR